MVQLGNLFDVPSQRPASCEKVSINRTIWTISKIAIVLNLIIAAGTMSASIYRATLQRL